MRYPQFIEAFSLLGSCFPPSNDLVRVLNEFTCLLYGDSKSKNVDECRYALFSSGKCSDEVLPPTQDARLRTMDRENVFINYDSRKLQQKTRSYNLLGKLFNLPLKNSII